MSTSLNSKNYFVSWDPEGRYHYSTVFRWEPEGHRLSLYKVYGGSALLVLIRTSLNSVNTLLVLSSRFVQCLAESKFELAVINPAFVIGPVLCGVPGTSIDLVRRLMERNPAMVADINIAVCDVRDVAKAHLRAMVLPEAAGDFTFSFISSIVWISKKI